MQTRVPRTAVVNAILEDHECWPSGRGQNGSAGSDAGQSGNSGEVSAPQAQPPAVQSSVVRNKRIAAPVTVELSALHGFGNSAVSLESVSQYPPDSKGVGPNLIVIANGSKSWSVPDGDRTPRADHDLYSFSDDDRSIFEPIAPRFRETEDVAGDCLPENEGARCFDSVFASDEPPDLVAELESTLDLLVDR